MGVLTECCVPLAAVDVRRQSAAGGCVLQHEQRGREGGVTEGLQWQLSLEG